MTESADHYPTSADVMARWDEMDSAAQRVIVAMPSQMTEAAARLDLERLKTRAVINTFCVRLRPPSNVNLHDEMVEALRAIDDCWTESFPKGPFAEDRSIWGGIGQLSEETVEIWKKIRSALSKSTPTQKGD